MPLRSANIIGSGPNGLAAAITLAQRGVAVTVFERNPRPGGACSTAELTLPGFLHDLGSSAYPLGIASPFFRTLPLEQHGLRWLQPAAPLAHPLDHGEAITQEHSLDATCAQLSAHDARAWRALFASTARNLPALLSDVTGPLLRIPHHPFITARFGLPALLPAQTLANLLFRDDRTKALFAGMAAHSVLPLSYLSSSAAGLILGAAGHAGAAGHTGSASQPMGWPIAQGGAQSITNALVAHLQSLGGQLVLDTSIAILTDLPAADATFFDTSTDALIRIAADALSPGYIRALRRFQPGPAIFKLDYALSAPIPWANPACARAATVHLGGTLPELAASELAACRLDGRAHPSDNPFVLLVQPSLFDPTRAPYGKHTAWAYCHVPHGSMLDRTAAIERQIARFAPGFRDVVLARHASNATTLTQWNPNLTGGDISGGAMTLPQLIARPTLRTYRTSNPRLYLCSASTPPGGGVHGMCGHHAALTALEHLRG